MKYPACLIGLLCVLAIGCEAEQSAQDAPNPNGNVPAQHEGFSPAPPMPAVLPSRNAPNLAAPAVPQRPLTGRAPVRNPVSSAARAPSVPDAGRHALQLPLHEYSRMARRASEMLSELTEIHIAVDESGDATPYQDRWGELTANLTQLHREVLQTGYPPAAVANHLKESSLPMLEATIANAAQAIAQHTSVDSGLRLCHAEAEAIYAHFTQTRDDPPVE